MEMRRKIIYLIMAAVFFVAPLCLTACDNDDGTEDTFWVTPVNAGRDITNGFLMTADFDNSIATKEMAYPYLDIVANQEINYVIMLDVCLLSKNSGIDVALHIKKYNHSVTTVLSDGNFRYIIPIKPTINRIDENFNRAARILKGEYLFRIDGEEVFCQARYYSRIYEDKPLIASDTATFRAGEKGDVTKARCRFTALEDIEVLSVELDGWTMKPPTAEYNKTGVRYVLSGPFGMEAGETFDEYFDLVTDDRIADYGKDYFVVRYKRAGSEEIYETPCCPVTFAMSDAAAEIVARNREGEIYLH